MQENSTLHELEAKAFSSAKALFDEHERLGYIASDKNLRKHIDTALQTLKASRRKSEARTQAAIYLKNAIMWLGLDLKELGEANPYPNSFNPASPDVAPTADNLKL